MRGALAAARRAFLYALRLDYFDYGGMCLGDVSRPPPLMGGPGVGIDFYTHYLPWGEPYRILLRCMWCIYGTKRAFWALIMEACVL